MALNQVNLMGPVAQQPLDIQAEQAKLALAQKIAEALLLKSSDTSAPPSFATSPGNPFSRTVPNIGGPLGDIITAYRNKEALEDITSRQADLAKQLQGREAEGLTSYYKQKYGTKGEALPEGEQGPPTPTLAPDPIGAMVAALNKGLPGLTKIVEEDRKGIPTLKDWLPHADKYPVAGRNLASQTLQPGDLGTMPKFEVHDNVGITSVEGRPTERVAAQTFTTKPPENGIPPVSVSNVTGEAKGLTGGTTTPEATYAKAYGEGLTKELIEGRKNYIDDTGRMQTISQIKSILPQVPDSAFGSAGVFRNETRKVFEMLGGNPDPKTDKVEILQQQLGKLMLDKIRLLAPVTKEDIAQMEKIVGSVGMTKRGIMEALDLMQTVTERGIERHAKFVENTPVPQGLGITQSQHNEMWAPSFNANAVPLRSSQPVTKSWNDLQ